MASSALFEKKQTDNAIDSRLAPAKDEPWVTASCKTEGHGYLAFFCLENKFSVSLSLPKLTAAAGRQESEK